MPLFPEAATSGYITCTELHDTVKRAMDTWAINHKKIYFRDVTDQCRNITSLSQKCPAAELFIVPDELKPSSLTVARDLAAYVTHNTQNIDYNPYTTSGYRLNTGLGVRDCTMTLRAPLSSSDFCWYLDTTFCYGFHRWKESGFDVILILRIVGSVLFALSLLMMICVCVSMCNAVTSNEKVPLELRMPTGGTMMDLNAKRQSQVMQQHGDLSEDLECGSRHCTNLVDFLSVMPTCTVILSLFFLIFIPAFYFRIFLPCWDCYDFEATIAHEVGHVLGFHHPDAEWELNLNANRPMGPNACQNALDHVYLNKSRAIKDSLMFSLTAHRDRTCLTPDDLEGLNFLYPSCAGAATLEEATGQPKCIKAARYVGWLRLAIGIALPWLVVSTLAMLGQQGLRYHQRKRLKSLELVALRLAQQRTMLIKKVGNRASVGLRKSIMGKDQNLAAKAKAAHDAACKPDPPNAAASDMISIETIRVQR